MILSQCYYKSSSSLVGINNDFWGLLRPTRSKILKTLIQTISFELLKWKFHKTWRCWIASWQLKNWGWYQRSCTLYSEKAMFFVCFLCYYSRHISNSTHHTFSCLGANGKNLPKHPLWDFGKKKQKKTLQRLFDWVPFVRLMPILNGNSLLFFTK